MITQVKVNGIEEISRNVAVKVNPFDFLRDMIPAICGVPSDAYIKDGCVVTAEDTSYHGSASYEYTKYEVSELDKEILSKILELEKLLSKKEKIIK